MDRSWDPKGRVRRGGVGFGEVLDVEVGSWTLDGSHAGSSSLKRSGAVGVGGDEQGGAIEIGDE